MGISLTLVLAAGGSSYCCYKYKQHDDEPEEVPMEDVKDGGGGGGGGGDGNDLIERLKAAATEADGPPGKIRFGIKVGKKRKNKFSSH